MQYVSITSARIQLFIFQRNNGAHSSLIASTDKPNPFPFVGHRNTDADIIIRSLICITDSLILLIEQEMQIWAQSGQEAVSKKWCLFLLHLIWKVCVCCGTGIDSVCIRGPRITPHIDVLVLSGCSRWLFDETQRAKNMICIFILSSEEPWCCFVLSRCNIDPCGSFFRFVFLQPISAEHRIRGIWTKAFSSCRTGARDISSSANVSMIWWRTWLAVCFNIPDRQDRRLIPVRAPISQSNEWTETCSVSVSTNPSAQPTRSLYALLGLKSACYI